ncbi:MAG: hypothetical protein PHO62_01280 [Sulfurimonas sp.]|uniref:hypothetical protein n=1 Tax=Sulfurimonas sp. TaxID=2022749 RepID=UPI002615C640|nr:hypothetical protein [Sulfurimonas sp.]MDD5372037.1 hypothetical protein [Sulfurimonas sp.]
MLDYQRILKDCFLDMRLEVQDIKAIAEGSDLQKKSFLFAKILLNNTKPFSDLTIFSQDDLKLLLENYKVPQFNGDFAFRRKNMAEVYFFDKPLLIDELKWIA